MPSPPPEIRGGSTSSSALTVVVRVRPMNESEKSKRFFQCVFPLDRKRLLLVDPEKYEKNILRQNRQHERQFGFDSAFGPNSSQIDVHEATTAPLVESVVQGYNATIFAYGATGSGKTYTMIGTKENPGLMSLLTKSLYDKIDDDYTVLLSYLEVYNEVIRDLLNPTAGILELMEDDKGNVRVPGLSSVQAPNINRVSLMRNNRQHGKLFLIDLAGSERASNTNNKGQRLKEGAAINRSLLALGNVINSLSSGNKTRYVNYRDSKLTRLLKDSLGGNAKTCMIAHVTAASGHYEETYNTLVYASRAKNITTRPIRNRPSSADAGYNEAVEKMRRDADRRSIISHAVSTNNLPDKALERVRWNGSTTVNGAAAKKEGARSTPGGVSLFSQLKEQYMGLTSKQKRLREKLMRANEESYEVSMNRTSKMAILAAWERQNNIGEKTAESIERLKADVASLALETRLRAQAASREQNELVDLIVRMAEIEAEKISVTNDLAIHDLIMKKTDNSMAKLQKYETLAEKLIEGHVDENERQKMEQEYRIVKNQFHYHLIPLKNIHSTVSWNTELLPNISTPHSSKYSDDGTGMGSTFVMRGRKQRGSLTKMQSIQRCHSQEFETSSDVDLGSPTSLHMPTLNAF